MKIITIAQKQDKKFLRRKTVDFDFTKHKPEETRKRIRNMRLIMKKASGVGLAANQVGFNFRMFVAEFDNKFYAVFNPEIIKRFGGTEKLDEGCLSVPGVYGAVQRAEKVVLAGFDKNGKRLRINAWGFLARIFQHEVDHLNGVLFIDAAEDVRTTSTQKAKNTT